jgi:molybdate transport system substrate-binding protein
MLRNWGRVSGVDADWFSRVRANVVSQEENVKGVVTKVQLGEADAGVVYQSDVTPEVARFVSVLEIPTQVNITAAYPIAVVRGSPATALARRFIDFVRSAPGQRLLRQHGFQPITANP